MTCMGFRGKCWLPAKNGFCSVCQLMKDKVALENLLSNSYDREITASYIYSKAHERIINIQDNFDRIASFLKHDKPLLYDYISSNKALFSKRVYTHNDSHLCDVVCHMTRQSPEIPVPGNCLRCLAHTLRYTDDQYLRSLILRSVVVEYADGPNIPKMVQKSRRDPIYEFGSAILEIQGPHGVFGEFLDIVDAAKNPERIEVVDALIRHPVNHIITLQVLGSDTGKKDLYKMFKARKNIFHEELLAKSMHPSRVFHWCLDNEEMLEMGLIPYQFKKGKAEWDICL